MQFPRYKLSTQILGIIFGALTLLLTTQVLADELEFHPLPEWVIERPLDLGALKPAVELQTGFEYITHESQVKHTSGNLSYYTRNAFAVHTMTAVNQLSNINFSYIPLHQAFKVHHVRIYRNGKVLDMRDAIQTRFVRQESATNEPTDQLTTGVTMLVGGVLMGDVIDYALTIEGRDPTYNDIIEGAHNQTGGDVSNLYRRILVPKKEKIHIKHHAGHVAPKITKLGKEREYLWDFEPATKIELEGNTPNWFVPIPFFEYSNFSNWRDIALWGENKFAVDSEDHSNIAETAKKLSANITSEDELIRATLNFVQANIRYVGPGIGRNGHQPFPADIVLKRRYGDCKDKSRLMQALLQEMEIDAWPALVNSFGAKILDIRLPSMSAFDHAIVYVKSADKEYWLDPTALPQQNRTASLEPAYIFHKALILNKKSQGLSVIPEPVMDKDDFHLRHEITFNPASDLKENSPMSAKTEYIGFTANIIRSFTANYGTYELNKEHHKHYKDHFDNIEQTTPISLVSTDKPDGVSLLSEYLIPEMWELDSKTGHYTFKHHPCKLRKEMPLPPEKPRETPYALAYPLKVIEKLRFKIPQDQFELEPLHEELNTRHFTFKSHSYWEDEHYIAEYRLITKTDHVLPEEYESFRSDIKLLRKLANYYTLSMDSPAKAPTEASAAPQSKSHSSDSPQEFERPPSEYKSH